jgi:hypothetical protein
MVQILHALRILLNLVYVSYSIQEVTALRAASNIHFSLTWRPETAEYQGNRTINQFFAFKVASEIIQ